MVVILKHAVMVYICSMKTLKKHLKVVVNVLTPHLPDNLSCSLAHLHFLTKTIANHLYLTLIKGGLWHHFQINNQQRLISMVRPHNCHLMPSRKIRNKKKANGMTRWVNMRKQGVRPLTFCQACVTFCLLYALFVGGCDEVTFKRTCTVTSMHW